MTPDIHTKTYAERSGLGGIASGMGAISNGVNGATSLHNGANNPQYTNIHQSAKNKNHQLMALTIQGGSGINSSMFAGVPSANNNNSNLGMYQNNVSADN